uniref:SFRICE_028804 n=1 Tax=Spodoptera frugiperda TaxID=7108 RepID=A0A2H1WFV8_SPOFR
MGRLDRSDTTVEQKTDPQKADNALVTPLVFRMSMGGGDCLPSADPSAHLPAYPIKKKLVNLQDQRSNPKLPTQKSYIHPHDHKTN